MNRLITWLTAALALQLLVSAALFWPRPDSGEAQADEELLTIDPAQVNRLVISDSTSTLLLSREEGSWRLSEYHNLPIDEARLERVLTELPAQRRGWPLADSANAAERFEVAQDKFQRRVEFFSGEDSLGVILVGTAPGFRKVHVRNAADSGIHAVTYNSFDLPAQPVEWLDKALLQVDGVKRVVGLDYRIEREGDNWRGDNGGLADADAVAGLINGLGSLRVSAAADIATAAILEEMAAPPTLSVEAEGGSYEFRLFEIEDAYYIQRDDIAVYFTLSALDYDRLNQVTAESLYEAPTQAGEQAADGESMPDGQG